MGNFPTAWNVRCGILRTHRPRFKPHDPNYPNRTQFATPARSSTAPGTHRWGIYAILAALLLACPGAEASADAPAVTDATVDAAIQRGVAWLKARHQPGTQWEENVTPDDQYWGGTSGLAVLALLYAGEDPRSDLLAAALDWLTAQTLRATYTYGVRAHALALVRGEKYRKRLEADLAWLLGNVWPKDSASPGAYGYTGKTDGWDNSNTQYGVLGAWMATDAGLNASDAYWELVAGHWLGSQQPDGGWAYKETGQPTGSMTAAGLASLFVVLDRLYADRPKDAAPVTTAIERGLNWLGREFTPENPFGGGLWNYYYLYGVERVGHASGYKYFREKDWFKQGAAHLLKSQHEDGSWPGTGEGMSDARNTCFALMFLCHGRAPLLFNKLAHGPDWNHRLRDLAGLTNFAQRSLERLLNWQIVHLDGPLDDLLEAPVLYLSGQTAWDFTDVEVQKIREYGLRGGLLLAVPVAGSAEFTESMRRLAERAFPEFRLRPLPSEHPLFSGEIQFTLPKPPPMEEVHNGLRTLMLSSAVDIAETWSRPKGRREHFELGCNIYNYATDKTGVRSRLVTPTIPRRPREPRRQIEVALVQYEGNWNVEPYAWTRLRNYLHNEANTRLLVASGIKLDAPALEKFKIAHIGGTAAFALSPAEQEGLKRFFRNGGTLLADAAGGADEFHKSLETHLNEVLGVESKRLPPDSFIASGAEILDTVDLSGVGYTRAARRWASEKGLPVRVYDVGRRYAVIYSPLDLTGGLLGTHIYNRRGFDSDSALRVLRNLLLYADLPAREKSRLARE